MVSSGCPRWIVKPRASRSGIDIIPMVRVVVISVIKTELIIVSRYAKTGSKLHLAIGSKWYTTVLLNWSIKVPRQRNVTLESKKAKGSRMANCEMFRRRVSMRWSIV